MRPDAARRRAPRTDSSGRDTAARTAARRRCARSRRWRNAPEVRRCPQRCGSFDARTSPVAVDDPERDDALRRHRRLQDRGRGPPPRRCTVPGAGGAGRARRPRAARPARRRPGRGRGGPPRCDARRPRRRAPSPRCRAAPRGSSPASRRSSRERRCTPSSPRTISRHAGQHGRRVAPGLGLDQVRDDVRDRVGRRLGIAGAEVEDRRPRRAAARARGSGRRSWSGRRPHRWRGA